MVPRPFKTKEEILAWLREQRLLAESPQEKPKAAPQWEDPEEDDPRQYEIQWEQSMLDLPTSAPSYAPEPIPPRNPPSPAKPAKEQTPPLLREARRLAVGRHSDVWSSEVFMEQGKLLADYTDDYENLTNILCYYPTYERLSYRELRSYFSWRTKARRGQWEKTSLSFAFLYAYELINQIGVTDPLDGYRKLLALWNNYSPLDERIDYHLEDWVFDYVPYYSLDPQLLADTETVCLDNAAYTLEQAPQHSATELLDAFQVFVPRYLEKSIFYRDHREDMELVLVGVLRGLQAHYAGRTRGLVATLFGPSRREFRIPFDNAIFCRKRQKDRVYPIDPLRQYSVEGGRVFLIGPDLSDYRKGKKLEALAKSVDAALRQATGYGHPLKAPEQKQWVDKLIRQEVQALLDRKAAEAAEKARQEALPKLDLGSLDKIRRDADLTRDRLMVEEEAPEEELPAAAPAENSPAPTISPAPVVSPAPAEVPPAEDGLPLTTQERRFLGCLLYGRDLGWLRQAGVLPSVLADSVNEKLYDEFLDIVINDDLTVVPDYAEDLKGRIPQ